jgi:hypothetical protein
VACSASWPRARCQHNPLFPLHSQDALAASFKATDAQGVTTITDELLASLGDPFTRLLQPGSEEAAVLQAEQEGKVGATAVLHAGQCDGVLCGSSVC